MQQSTPPTGGGLRLAVDALCILFEDMPGMLRLRITPSTEEVFENVSIMLRDMLSGAEYTRSLYMVNGVREFSVPIKPKPAGTAEWNVWLRYERGGHHEELEGELASVVIGRAGARGEARHLAITINQDIKGGHACEINNSMDAVGKLNEALRSVDGKVFDALSSIVIGPTRSYRWIDLYPRQLSGTLPQQPAAAKTDRLILDLGTQRLQLFSARTVTFGRYGDISWRSPFAGGIHDNMLNNMPYDKISRYQCFFEHSGKDVVLYDGSRKAPAGHENLQRTEFGTYPSAYGTKFNDVRVNGKKLLGTDGSGILSFSDSTAKGKLSVCLPGAACAECTRADRTWCQNGKRPSLVFKRLDGVPESAVMVWSCFRLEELDPSFEGVKIFRSDGGFAWRRGRRCGWLVPGSSIETDCGLVKVERLPTPEEKMESAKKVVRNDTGTCHS